MSQAAGRLVLVVGPSGAGKDSIIRYARERLARDKDFQFPRRVVTRIADTEAEDHDTLSETEFDALQRAGGFAVSWQAHGLKYGVPLLVMAGVVEGKIMVLNVSRTIIGQAVERYPGTVIAEIAASPENRAARIAARGRESLADALARGMREVPLPALSAASIRIINDGPLADAGEEFCRFLWRLRP